MTFAALLFLLCQEDVYIRKIDKVRYIEAVQACKEAESKLESDEAAAIDKLTRIIQDPALNEVECTLRIQQSDIFGPPYAYLPYQYRARARLSLARKTTAAAEKKQLLEDAIRDLKFSVGRKVASSQKLLDGAQAELGRLAPPAVPAPPAPENSAVRIRAQMSPLLGEHKFKSARALIDAEAALPESDRAGLVAETQQTCRAYLTEQMRSFRRNWSGAATLADLQALTRDEFDLAFALPEAREIVVSHPSYDWARSHLGTLRAASAGKSALAPLLAMAEDAAKLEEGSENPWFKLAEGLAFQWAQRDLDQRISECLEAPRARREVLLGEATAALSAWTAFVGRLEPAFRKRSDALDGHTRTLGGLLDRKPRDLAELELEDLRSCFEAFPVEDRLLAMEGKLVAWETQGGLTCESRQKLGTLLVASRSLRMFLAGKTEDQVRQALRGDLEKLSKVGGASDPDRFGPRVRKIFDSLR